MSKITYEGAIFDVVKTQPVIDGKTVDRDLVHMNQNAVIGAVFDLKTHKLLVTHEYRIGPQTVTDGFVAGKIEPGEEPLHAFMRELTEETGIHPNVAISRTNPAFYTSEGFTDETITPILVIIDGYTVTATHFDKDESVNSIWVSLNDFDASKMTGLPAQFLYQQLRALDINSL